MDSNWNKWNLRGIMLKLYSDYLCSAFICKHTKMVSDCAVIVLPHLYFPSLMLTFLARLIASLVDDFSFFYRDILFHLVHLCIARREWTVTPKEFRTVFSWIIQVSCLSKLLPNTTPSSVAQKQCCLVFVVCNPFSPDFSAMAQSRCHSELAWSGKSSPPPLKGLLCVALAILELAL